MAEAKLTASSAAQSFMVRVNLVPFTGTMEGEKVVSGASRSATLNGLVLVDGNRTPETSILGFAGTPDPNDLGQQLLEGVAEIKLRDATKGDPPPDQVGIIRSQALTQRIPID